MCSTKITSPLLNEKKNHNKLHFKFISALESWEESSDRTGAAVVLRSAFVHLIQALETIGHQSTRVTASIFTYSTGAQIQISRDTEPFDIPNLFLQDKVHWRQC